jgi:hypothetical protein
MIKDKDVTFVESALTADSISPPNRKARLGGGQKKKTITPPLDVPLWDWM